MNNETRIKIHNLRNIEGKTIKEISTMLNLNPSTVTAALLPLDYKPHDTICCEYCGQIFDPYAKKVHGVTCSKKCASSMNEIYRAIAMGLTTKKDAIETYTRLHEVKTEERRGMHYDAWLDTFICDEPASQKHIKAAVNESIKANKSYGNYERCLEESKAKETGKTIDEYINDSFEEWCRTSHRDERVIV